MLFTPLTTQDKKARKDEGMGWSRGEMDGVGEQLNRDLDRERHYGVKGKPGAEEIPKNPQKVTPAKTFSNSFKNA